MVVEGKYECGLLSSWDGARLRRSGVVNGLVPKWLEGVWIELLLDMANIARAAHAVVLVNEEFIQNKNGRARGFSPRYTCRTC